jgi:hypothetical protein
VHVAVRVGDGDDNELEKPHDLAPLRVIRLEKLDRDEHRCARGDPFAGVEFRLQKYGLAAILPSYHDCRDWAPFVAVANRRYKRGDRRVLQS